MASTNQQNNLASNIPLPPGTPPPLSHQQQHHQQPHQIPIFGSAARPMSSFATLAKRTEPTNVVECTLNQYGPRLSVPVSNPMSHMQTGVSMPNYIQQRQLQHQQQQHQLLQQQQLLRQQQQQHQQQQLMQQQQQQQQHLLQRQQHMQQGQMAFQQPNQAYQHQQQILINQGQIPILQSNMQPGMTRPPVYLTNPMPPHCQPTPATSVPTYHISHNLPTSGGPTVNQNNIVINTMDMDIATTPISTTLPETSLSPPLDAIRGSGNPNNITSTTSLEDEQKQKDDMAKTEPKKDLLTQVKENWDKWSVNQMISEHKSLQQQLVMSKGDRDRLEREINDLIRKNPGQNIELNPSFIRKKGDLTESNRRCDDINQAIKFVAEKSDKKYGRKLDAVNTRQPLQVTPQQPKRFQRAKMSTAAPSPSVPKDDSRDRNYLLDLRDDNLWCQACDVHFKSLKEYCNHLHKREHSMNVEVNSQPPWRKDSSRRQLARYETFCKYKSICSDVDATVDTEFKMVHLDKVLNPTKDKEEIKMLSLKRERKQFEDNDSLFSYKGYDEIVPISGYYCKLCNRTLCDEKEVETHLKSYTHNLEHLKSIALQPSHEKDFRLKMDKSLKLLKESEKSPTHRQRDTSSKPPPVRERSPGLQNGLTSTGGARLPYKKPTSKIVDEHDIIADKFDKRQEKDSVKTKKTNSTSGDSPKKASSKPPRSPLKRSRMPEIVPIAEHQPAAALKRLKRDRPREQIQDPPQELVKESNQEPLIVDAAATNKDVNDKTNDQSTQIVIHSDTEEEVDYETDQAKTTAEQPSNDVQILGEVHLQQGDPESPFPDLEIVVTGNYPLSALKDERLSRGPSIKLNRLNLEDYKDMLLDESSLWARIDKLMTKKEPDEFQKDLDSVTFTAPVYFAQDGAAVPVQADRDSSDEGEQEFKMDSLEGFFCS